MTVDWTVWSTCLISLSSIQGCSTCACASSGACSAGDLKQEGCGNCEAFSSEVCNSVGTDGGIASVVAKISVILILLTHTALAHISLITLVRKEDQDASKSARLTWIRSQVLDQCRLLESGCQPTIDGAPLVKLIHACEDWDPSIAERAKSLVAMWEARQHAEGWTHENS